MDSFQRENLWKYDSQFDNTLLLNSFSITTLFQPLVQYEEVEPVPLQNAINFMECFVGGQQCKNSLRLLSTESTKQAIYNSLENEDNLMFCMHQKNELSQQKRYSILPFYQLERKGQKSILSLDQPNKILIINNTLLIAVQKKCITLYHIHDEHLMLKDYDSIGIGNRLILVDLCHLKYKNKDYLLVFGNQKEDTKPFFKCLVYEISQEKLHFIKKATIYQRQTYKPIILFEKYQGNKYTEEKYCLVVGGYADYEQQAYIFSALQIHLHLLIQEWVQYPFKMTREVLFNHKHTITSGKAIKISYDIATDQSWLLFCTEYQTITKMYIRFGHQKQDQFCIQNLQLCTKTLKIRNETKGQVQPLYYSQNTLFLVRMPQQHPESMNEIPYRIYWCDKTMERVRFRPLRQLLQLFVNK